MLRGVWCCGAVPHLLSSFRSITSPTVFQVCLAGNESWWKEVRFFHQSSHTHRGRQSQQRQNHWVHTSMSACMEVGLCVSMCEIPPNHTKLLLHFTYSSAEVMVSLLARSPSLTLYFLLSHFLSSSTPCLLPSALYIRSCFFLSPWRLPKFDAEPSVNQTNIAPQPFFQFFLYGLGCHISVLIDSYYTYDTHLLCERAGIGGLCVSVFLSTQVCKKDKTHNTDMFVVYD